MKLGLPEGLRARLRKPGYKYLGIILGLALLAMTPRWIRAMLHSMTFFHVRTIEIRGTRYLQPSDVVARLRIDTLRSIVDDVKPLEVRLRSHPQISAVTISRKPPGTLVVTVTENLPVALVPGGDGLRPFDSAGKALPIDPSRIGMDLPILSPADPGALRTLGAIRSQVPEVYAVISQVRREGERDLVFVLDPAPGLRGTAVPATGGGDGSPGERAGELAGSTALRVRASVGVAPNRFRDIFPVTSDLVRRAERPVELDLRFRDQVVARLP